MQQYLSDVTPVISLIDDYDKCHGLFRKRQSLSYSGFIKSQSWHHLSQLLAVIWHSSREASELPSFQKRAALPWQYYASAILHRNSRIESSGSPDLTFVFWVELASPDLCQLVFLCRNGGSGVGQMPCRCRYS